MSVFNLVFNQVFFHILEKYVSERRKPFNS